MKSILFFLCMIACGINFAEAARLADVTCTDESGISHSYSLDSEDNSVIFIDGHKYDFVHDSTVGDVSFTRYKDSTDPMNLAFLNIEFSEDGDASEVKLVLMRSGSDKVSFGALCE